MCQYIFFILGYIEIKKYTQGPIICILVLFSVDCAYSPVHLQNLALGGQYVWNWWWYW
jgi:hypothetical protein